MTKVARILGHIYICFSKYIYIYFVFKNDKNYFSYLMVF